jgi:hypothetical protein
MTLLFKALSLALAFALTGCAERSLEAKFAAQRAHYRRLAGVTDEPSCGGTGVTIFLAGNDVRKVAYSVETSQRLIQRDYYLRDRQPVLVVETSHFLLDQQAERLREPRLEAVNRYSFGEPAAIPAHKRKEFQAHVRYLLTYFRDHPDDFKPAHK